MIDLRSDTVTRPTPGMYAAMTSAELGDDMAGEDPTVNRLEALLADRLGKDAAVFCPSGTMSNQLGLRCHCRPGDELLIHETGHVANYEGGAPAAISGISCRLLPGDRGLLDLPTLTRFQRPTTQHHPRTRLVCLENTTNMGGGAVWPLAHLREVSGWAREREMAVHLDGARLFNAILAGGYTLQDAAATADTVSVCFSKGLGCPVGSLLAGSTEQIARARRDRKLLGGAMRQAGILAAAALYALEHHLDRLAQDHDLAREFAATISHAPLVSLPFGPPETNIVIFELAEAHPLDAAELSRRLAEQGVRINPIGPRRLRAVTHLDVIGESVRQAAEIVTRLVTEPLPRRSVKAG